MKRAGKKSAAQTPAPKSERVFGSKTNAPKSAASKNTAKNIVFSYELNQKIQEIVKKYNLKNERKKITIPTAKAVVRRGMGAYSTSHRPTISGGKPNSRVAWGLSRLHAFMRKKSSSRTANGTVSYREIKKSYTQDNDLL